MKIVITHTALLAGLFATVSACASQAQTRLYQDETANHVGCVPEQIGITDADESHWTATCHRQTYYCSKTKRHAGAPPPPGEEGSDEVSCAEVK